MLRRAGSATLQGQGFLRGMWLRFVLLCRHVAGRAAAPLLAQRYCSWPGVALLPAGGLPAGAAVVGWAAASGLARARDVAPDA